MEVILPPLHTLSQNVVQRVVMKPRNLHDQGHGEEKQPPSGADFAIKKNCRFSPEFSQEFSTQALAARRLFTLITGPTHLSHTLSLSV